MLKDNNMVSLEIFTVTRCSLHFKASQGDLDQVVKKKKEHSQKCVYVIESLKNAGSLLSKHVIGYFWFIISNQIELDGVYEKN